MAVYGNNTDNLLNRTGNGSEAWELEPIPADGTVSALGFVHGTVYDATDHPRFSVYKEGEGNPPADPTGATLVYDFGRANLEGTGNTENLPGSFSVTAGDRLWIVVHLSTTCAVAGSNTQGIGDYVDQSSVSFLNSQIANDNSVPAPATIIGYNIQKTTPPPLVWLDYSASGGGGDTTSPTVTGESISSVTSTTIGISAISDESGVASVLVMPHGASQPSDPEFDASTDTATIVADEEFTVSVTGVGAGAVHVIWARISDEASNHSYISLNAYTPRTAYFTIELTSIAAQSSGRLESGPDLIAGAIVEWSDSSVSINDDATFDVAASVSSFSYRIIDLIDGDISDEATQSITTNGEFLSAGGIVLSGTSLTTKNKSYRSNSAIQVSGASVPTKHKSYTTELNVALSGVAQISLHSALINYVSTGGLSVAGVHSSEKQKHFTAQGQIVVDGTASISEFGEIPTHFSNGGASLSGAANTLKNRSFVTTGGAVLGGSSHFTKFRHFRVGGLIVIQGSTDYVTATPTVVEGYISRSQLADRPGVRELSEVATPQNKHIVNYELMKASLHGASRNNWSAEDINVANDALKKIDAAILDAGSVIDGFLQRRGYLPLSSPPAIVVTWARAITRYMLHKDRISDDRSDPIVRDYNDAMKLLNLCAQGKFSLGVNDSQVQQGVGDVLISHGRTTFRSNMDDY